MSLKWRITLLIAALLVLMVGGTTYMMQSERARTTEQTQAIIGEIESGSQQNARKVIEEVSVNMATQIATLEQELERSMLNAAYTLQGMDSMRRLLNEDLKKIAVQTGMNDLYLTDRQGVFISATEPKAVGLNLFEIGGEYRGLVSGQTQVVPSDLKIKQETGEIYKFMAIPRLYNKGIVETAVNAQAVANSLNAYVQNQNGVQSVYLIDKNNLVLTETLRQGQSSLLAKGKNAPSEAVSSVFQSGTLQLNMNEGGIADVYVPVRAGEKTRYVLYTRIDANTYLLNSEIAKQSLLTTDQQQASSIHNMILLNVGLGVLFLFVVFLIIQQNVRPLVRMTQAAGRMAAGDLTTPEIPAKSRSEIGLLATSFNQMASNLRLLVSEVGASSKRLTLAAEELNASTAQTNTAAGQIAVSSERVASGAETQVRSMQESVEITSRLNQDVTKIAHFTHEVTQMAGTARERAADGHEAVDLAVGQIHSINETLLGLAAAIKGLGEQSQQIGHFVETIKSIAAQTNLLAINATIEAAKAGEHGQGFTVVAAEVRLLAEQAVTSAQEITQLSTMIRSETDKAVQSMEATTQEVEAGIRIVAGAGTVFDQIRDAVETIAGQIQDVSKSTQDMSAGAKQVERTIEAMTIQVEQTAWGTQDISASTEEQVASMQEVGASAAVLTEMADDLQHMIDKFTVETKRDFK